MVGKRGKYRAIVSSDWNECLAPTGPFDVITFHYPELAQTLSGIFRDYTGNKISLGRAVEEIKGLLPGPITKDHMDAYLDASFRIYRGVPEFIEWCLKKDILFMINTTAFQGFCQRAIAKGLIPQVQVVSAYPMVRYGSEERVGTRWMDLLETNDKPINTQKVMKEAGISPDRVILIGDSGGDGPHFEWGGSTGALLVGSMTKWSLERYCRDRGIKIHEHFGIRYREGEERDPEREMAVDFMDLAGIIEGVLR